MARKINEGKALSASDRAYLTDWGKFSVIARIDAEHGVDEDSVAPVDVNAELVAILGKYGIDAGDDALAAVDAALGAKAAKTAVEAASDVPFTDDTDDAPEGGYADWLGDDLRKELGNRELSKSGNKEELVARLEEDDAENA